MGMFFEALEWSDGTFRVYESRSKLASCDIISMACARDWAALLNDQHAGRKRGNVEDTMRTLYFKQR